MSDAAIRSAEAMVQAAGLGRVISIHPIQGGANNRGFRLVTSSSTCLLKLYHHDPDDVRDRAATEFAFASFAWRGGIRQIPKPIALDPALHAALFAWVEPIGPRESPVDPSDIDQAMEFFTALNRLRANASSANLPIASEACFAMQDHLQTVDARVTALAAIDGGERSESSARAFVAGLERKWREVRGITEDALERLPAAYRRLPASGRCLSPSDFGFHNALRRADGSLVFHDFEYAGWDDPAKGVVDFFCQPRVPVPLRFWNRCVAAIDAATGSDTELAERALLLLDVYRIKWCCIALNAFLPQAARRRAFADSGFLEDVARRRAEQLAQARRILDQVGARPTS